MINLDQRILRINKAVFLMAGWGLLILLASVMNQFFDLPNPDYVLMLWGGVTVLGILCQTVALVRGLQLNFTVWLILIALGWAFTFYVVKFDNGAHIDLYGDLAGVWLILLGIGHLFTAFHVVKRFLLLGIIHILVGVALELSARGIVSVDFFDSYSTLIFGIVAGGSLIVGALPMWYRPRKPATAQAPAPTTQPTTSTTGQQAG
jgi:hypothetical protein